MLEIIQTTFSKEDCEKKNKERILKPTSLLPYFFQRMVENLLVQNYLALTKDQGSTFCSGSLS